MADKDTKATPAPAKAADTGVKHVEAQDTVSEKDVTVVKGNVKRQVIGEPRDASPVQPVHESYRKLDRVILDTSDPLAVQPGPKDPEPEVNPKTPEEKLADEAN